ncbi:MAG TPA: 50S ribosomal protein L6 [Verrucomicrobiota bacterium]|nr:50S ribosomal protein L6 [Verrucomicrobiota bacterium]
MSRIGKQPITVPKSAKVQIQGRKIYVEGPKGKLTYELPETISAELENGILKLKRESEDSKSKALHGLSRAIVNNLVNGVTEGFVKKLEIQGVGFKAAVQGNVLNLTLGYSHPINYSIPAQIKVTVEENTKITVEGPDKHLVGQVAADIRAFYPPEPYKGKGIRYVGEHIIRKEGKTVQ